MKKKLARYKVYMDRARQYTGYILFFMQTSVYLVTVTSGHLLELVKKHPLLTSIISFAAIFIGHLALGWFDYHKGLLTEEHRNYSETNPVTMDILETMKEIQRDVKELKCNHSTLEEQSVI